MKRILPLLLLAFALLSCTQTQTASFPQADSLINAAIEEGQVPGAVLCVVQADRILYNKAYGCRRVYPDTVLMTPNTIFDLASLSKVVGTGMTAMSLVDEGLLDLDAKVSQYLPDFEGDATIRDLMTHVSGLPAYAQWKLLLADHPDAGKAEKRDVLLNHVCHQPRHSEPRTRYVYSCLNFITLQYVMETITGKSLDELAQERVFGPLGMEKTGYNPGPQELVAPTEMQADSTCLWGVVHDPLAQVMNSGVSGNAGVFAPSEDLAKMALWIFATLDDKEDAKGPFNKQTLETMLRVPEGYEAFYRTPAWGVWEDFLDEREPTICPASVYHTGYTGTFIVVDPEHRLAVILLTHRVHPHDEGGINGLRRDVVDAIAHQVLSCQQ